MVVYDGPYDQPTALTDPLGTGARTTVAYDRLNQTREVTDPLGRTLTVEHDPNGNVTALTDARGNTTTWAYDNADRPASATDPLGAKVMFGYDPAGRLTKVTSRSGQVATSEYDLLGRTKNAKFGVDLAGQAESTTTYTYDAVDLLKSLSDTTSGTQSFTYDSYDRIRTVAGPTGTIGYDYDAADRRKEMMAAGTTTVYGYDTSGVLTSITADGRAVTFGLDEVGREKTASLPGGFTRTTDYDKTGTTRGIVFTRSGAAVGDLSYTRDERGLQTGLSGSLASVALPGAEDGAVYDKDNRLTSFNGRSFTYDDEGQLTSDGRRTYDWDARGRLKGLTETVGGGTGGGSGTFTYDPLGTRGATTLGGQTRKFLTDGSNPLVEQSGAGETTATVATSGLDQYLTRTENGKTQVYLTDALGTVVGLADPDGSIATRYTYDPYGAPTASGAESSNQYTFTGRENDGTGLLYYRSRYYDPETGRFISQDPIGYSGGANLYEYALSSPTTYTDPAGTNPMLIGCAVGGGLGGLIDWGSQRLSGRKVNWGQVGGAALMGCLEGALGARAPMCRVTNSFTADTPVLMADGTRKPIKDVRVGDKVAATDPETGESGPRAVTALIKGTGEKALVDIALDTGQGGKPAKITATEGHPFWVPDLGEWVEAGKLQPGQWLRTSAGTWTQITAIGHRTGAASVNNLTVDGLHTYYVLAGATSILAHNCGEEAGEYVYRGIDWGHSKYDDALEGRAVPRGGDADAASHNGGNLDSPFTSWTDDYEGVALDAAELGNGPGIVMRHRRAYIQDRLIKGPQDIYGESELLVEGVIEGAEISINRGSWHLPGAGR